MTAMPFHDDPSRLLDPWCRALLAQAMRDAGGAPDTRPDSGALAALFGATPKFRPLLAVYADLLRQPVAGDVQALRDDLLRQEPALATHIALAEACVSALPEILSEKVPATEVLFPNGSLQRVEGIYRDNPWADYFNRLTAEACFRAVATWRGQQPQRCPRILEIGAGTGGTTGFVLERLKGQRDAFEYIYTDLSSGFVQHGKRCFGELGCRMDFLRLDIEQDPSVYGLRPDSADIVIATNVLHATRRIGETLANVRGLLADNGLLLLNELTRTDAFAALTFGLLDGWWRFDDAEIRLPHSPIVPASGWRRALLENGFSAPAVYGWNGREDGFQCLFVSAAAPQAAVRASSRPTVNAPVSSTPKPETVVSQSDDGLRQIRRLLAKRLGFAESEIDWQRPFAELGVDSIVAPQFAADLSAALDLDVDAVDIYNHGSVAMLADALSLRQATKPATVKTASAPATDLPGDAIAVIGLACRFAGAPNAEAFWRLLESGGGATSPVKGERWDAAELAIQAGLLPEADCFDPDFFRISHAEAEVMDPQQRVFLEECWHALEDAGLPPATLEGQACGVFVGVAAQNHPANTGESRAALGNSNAILAARIAYHLNLKGPAVPVDTACSSSLVAIHLAASALRNGDCDTALAGGVSVLLCNDALPRFLVESGMVSPTGQCRAFDRDADGFVPGEGVGVLVLRRLDKALAAGDRILGIIRGSGINQDGRTSGITAPSGPAQTALLQQVWQRSAVDPGTLTLIEAHGTGTPLGDPIEVQSLTAALAGRTMQRPCALGSVKPNIGHTLTAAGVAGTIKILLALKHGAIPPSPHFSVPNPRLKLETSTFYIPKQAQPWLSDGPRRAAVSSFGFSGTNAHLLIEEAPLAVSSRDASAGIGLLLLSATDSAALKRTARQLADWLDGHPGIELADLNRTLNAGRAFFAERAAFLVDSPASFRRALQALLDNRQQPDLRQGRADPNADNRLRRINPADDLSELADYFVNGGLADWSSLTNGGRLLSLPGYPFARDRFPLPSTAPAERIENLRSFLPVHDPVFSEHRWDGRGIVPATALLVLAAEIYGQSPCLITAVRWSSPLPADSGSACLRIGAKGRISLESGLGTHAQATVSAAIAPVPDMPPPGMPPGHALAQTDVYKQLSALGFDYGPAFRVICELTGSGQRVFAKLDWQAGTATGRFPQIGLMDGMIQAAIGLASGTSSRPRTVIPFSLERAWLDMSKLTAPLRVEVSEDSRLEHQGERRLNFTVWNADGEAAAVLENLTVKVTQATASVSPLFYRPVWRDAALASGPSHSLNGRTVLLFSHAEKAPKELITCELILVSPGSEFTVFDDKHYSIRPGNAEDLAMLAKTLAAQGRRPDLWLNTWLLDGQNTDYGLAQGPLTLLYGLAAWLPFRDPAQPLSVLQVSRADNACHAASAALLRSVAEEQPRFTGKVLAVTDNTLPWAQLLAELDAPDGALEVSYDASGRRRIYACQAVETPSTAKGLRRGAVCLLTGGFGGVGLALAQYLSQRYQAKLVLLGRHPPHAAARQRLTAMSNDGADILEIYSDLSDPAILRREIAVIDRQWGPLDAVFHLAGVQNDGFLSAADPAGLEAVLTPKIAGTQTLLAALNGNPNVLLVTFGSLAGVFGAPGQAAYALANRAMAALSAQASLTKPQRQLLHLDWGYWDPESLTSGMVAHQRDESAISAATGLSPFRDDQAFDMLDCLLAEQGPWLLALGKRPVFEAFLSAKKLSPAQAEPVETAQFNAGQTASMQKPTDTEAFLAYLTGIVADITHTPIERLKPDRTLDEFGIDSIMVTRLNTRLEQDIGLISKTLFYEYPNLRALAGHLAKHHSAPVPGASSAADASGRQAKTANQTGGIAVIGMAGRFPQAGNVDAYWRNLLEGRICIDEIPSERWSLQGFFDPEPGKPGFSYSKWGGFIDGVDRFDPLFFNISPDEAARMDPQERLFLETAWQCLENAGLKRSDLGAPGERDIGVYVGVMYGDYQLLAQEAAGPHGTIGGAAPYWSIANRVSYTLGLEGPSLAVDSACSSSLSALHLACQAIASGDCRAALVGGVNLSLHPGKYIGLSQGRFASSDGLCRSFVANGDGYVPGEGVAAVLLKPLSAALADGDPIQGVILASSVNHGGRTNGYTVPSPTAQASAIRRALKKSGLAAHQLGYIEAHGTGTRLGDPIEIEGLQQALGKGLAIGSIPLGSAKAAIGHLEAAAGLAGLFKVLLQMRHGRYAAMPMAGPINPNLDFSTSPLRLQSQAAVWPGDENGHRYAGVSSFGAGGANAHVIIGNAPARTSSADDGQARVIPLSARSQAQVRALAKALAEHLDNTANPPSLADLCHTLTVGREALRRRCAFVAENSDHVRHLLKQIGDAQEGDTVFWGEAPDDDDAAVQPPGHGDLPSLAHFWCQGGAALWPQHGVRQPLAARPFLGARHWLKSQAPAISSPRPMHSDWTRENRPLQPGECGGWIFTVAADSTLFSQHHVGGEALLPGAAIAAMALELTSLGSLSDLNNKGLDHLTWLSPVAAGITPLRMDFSLRPDNDGIAFSVRRLDLPEAALVASGRLASVAPMPFDVIVPNDTDALAGADFYQRLTAVGLAYGPRFQVLQRLWRHNEYARAELQAPDRPAGGRIDPALLDGIFQTLAGLMGDWDQAHDKDLDKNLYGQGIPVPYTLGKLLILGDPNRAAQVFARRLSTLDNPVQRYALALLDNEGRVLAQIGELTARHRPSNPVMPAITLLRPLWLHTEAKQINPGRCAVLVERGSEDLAGELCKQLSTARQYSADQWPVTRTWTDAETLYYLDVAPGAQPPLTGDPAAWAEAAGERSLRLLTLLRILSSATAAPIRRVLVVTAGLHAVHASPCLPASSDAAGLQGLAKVAAREMPHLAVIAVDMPAQIEASAVAQLASEAGDGEGAEIAYRHGRRFVRRLQAVAGGPVAELPLTAGGACLIIGGNGGVGRILAKHWATRHGARIILLGRKSLDAGTEQFLAELRAVGGDGLYLQADAADPAALASAVKEAENRFGSIRLAVHSALVLQDKALARMEAADFRAAFAPRATVGASLLAAFTNRPPPLFLFFSSANLFLGQHGQANYVAGNAALAALHQAVLAQQLPSRLVHWGLWGEVGAVADAVTQARFVSEGILPISPDSGAAILPQALAAGSEIAAVRITPARLASLGLVLPTAHRKSDDKQTGLRAGDLTAVLAGTAGGSEAGDAAAAFQTLETYGLLRVAEIFRRLTVDLGQRRVTTARLLRELAVVEGYRRLALTLLTRLADLTWLDNRDGLWRLPSAETLQALLDEHRERLNKVESEAPWLSANRQLLEHCLEACADVLQGRVSGVSVLFPNGSGDKVAAAYSGNPVSDYANRLLCATVAAAVDSRLQSGTAAVRILEVGAGTGGTTLPLLEALQPWRERIDYHVSDLSPYLAKSLQDRCAALNWAVTASALDIGNAPEISERSRYDLIIAANVIHAGADVAAALSHLKARLVPGGRLAMIELTANRDLGTLIFGLTPQWWNAADSGIRLAGGPAICPPVWADLLSESGFTDTVLAGVENSTDGSNQSLITALADTWLSLDATEISTPASPKNPPTPAPAPTPAPPVPASHQGAVIDYLKSIFSAVLGVDPGDMRDGATFEHYGVESLSALEIRNRIAVDYPAVSSTLLFEHTTLQRLAEHLSGLAPAAKKQELNINTAGPLFSESSPPPANEAIAVIGFAGRFPGSPTMEDFWTLIRDGGCAIGPVPGERWDQSRYVDAAPQKVPSPGCGASSWGGFITGIDRFDPLFFGIAPLEAETMDPQERLFIETCWQALEDAGTTPARLAGQTRGLDCTGSVGVFCGVMNTAYQWLAAEAWRAGEDQAASSHFWSIPNRVSYLFDFDGPSLAVDTACSSSLTALHLACESLRRGECGAALVGGVNLIAHPRQLVNLSQAGMISNGNECRAFSDAADGFVDGEGVGVVVLKPLSRALADGDRIDGLILGSAVNAGGKTGGFTIPNPQAQSAVIRAALAQAGIDADTITLIETHGTGTALGDPIEIAGLLGALSGLSMDRKIPLGTLKANIGHLESAAGIAGLIKVLLQLRHETIAPARHAQSPNPLIRWPEIPFRLPGAAEPWPNTADRPRRAAVSGFGAGGANAHVIIQESPALRRHVAPLSPEIIPLSVRNPEQLPELAAQMAAAINRLSRQTANSNSPTLLADIGRTLREGRIEQAHCVRIRAHSLDELLDSLQRLARGETLPPSDNSVSGQTSNSNARPLPLPNSPFARQRYWLNIEPAPPGGVKQQSTQPPAVTPLPIPASIAPGSRHLQRRWLRSARPDMSVTALNILLVGDSIGLASALNYLDHRAVPVQASALAAALSKPVAGDHCLVVIETRNSADAAETVIADTLDIAQTVSRATVPVRLLHVSPLGGDGKPLPASFAIASLLRSLTAESPDCQTATLTMDLSDSGLAAAVVEELTTLDVSQTRQIQRRGQERRQLETIALSADRPAAKLAFRRGGHYLLVGGNGEVGKALARALAQRYQATVSIFGRGPLLSPMDGSIHYRRCDINNLPALQTALAESVNAHGAISGVLHLARQVTPASLRELTAASVAAGLAPKVAGSFNLVKALEPYRPDWLVFFSSLAAWAGQAGGADYAAACGFQDGLAANGGALPLLSVAWPQWQHDRFLHAEKRLSLSTMGLAALDADAGLDSLDYLLAHGPGMYSLLHGDAAAIETIIRRLQGEMPNWAGQLDKLDADTLLAYRDYLRSRLAKPTLPEPARGPMPEAFTASVLTICSDYLKIPPDVLSRSSFADLGLDSIRALHLAERLQRRLQRPVEPVMLFENPTVAELAAALRNTEEAL